MTSSPPDCRLGLAPRARGLRWVAALAIAELIVGLGGLGSAAAEAEAPPGPAPAVSSTWLRCGGLWDGRGGKTHGPTLIEGRADRIVSGRPGSDAAPDGKVIDLSGLTRLPGLIHSHTPVLLQGDN